MSNTKSSNNVPNILLVDDDFNFLQALEAVISGPGRMIFKAQSGDDALRQVLQRDFALIVLDVRMPGINGFETANLIHQRERSRYTPIIFMSGTETLGKDLMLGMAQGAVDYILKPFTAHLLQSKIDTFVNLFYLHERLKSQALQGREDVDPSSIPILTIRNGLIVVLILGLVDMERFNQLKKRLIQQITDKKPKAVVVDITGASVNNNIISNVQSLVKTARQLNLRIIFTGSNTSISNAMFVTNTKIEEVILCLKLEEGIQEAERILSD